MGCIIESYPNSKLWAKLENIEAEILAIESKRLICTQESPTLVGGGQTLRFSISVIDNSSGPVPAANIVAGTYDLIRIRSGIETTIQNDAPFTKADGLVYVDIEFDAATWDADDAYILAPNIDSTATLNCAHYYLPIAPWSGMIFDLIDITSKIDHITSQIDNGTYGLEATKNEIDNIEAKLDNGTFGLDALNTDLDTLLGRLTATRAGYLDFINNINLSTISNISTLNAINIGYLANINNVQLLNVPNLSTLTAARICYLDNINQAGLLQVTAVRAGYLDNINNSELLNIPDISTLSAARIGYLDELAAANLPTDVQNVYNDSLHSLKFTGTSWFVDGDSGNDANSGITPDLAFQHIANAITAAGIGDRIYVMAAAAAYDENNLDLNDIGLELYCEKGAVLSNSAGGATTAITLSANYTRVSGATFIQAGVSGVNVTGNVCLLDECLAANCAVGFDIDGFANTVKDCKSNNHATTGFDISDDSNSLENCISVGDGSSRGFYLSHANAGNNTLLHCQTANNGNGAGEAGYEVVASADNNIFSFCSMSDGDQKVDAGTNNTWSNFSEGSQIVAGQSRDQDLKNVFDNTTAILADAGDASGSGLGSLYSILGNPAQTFTAMVGYQGAVSLANKLTLVRAGYLDNINNAQLLNVPDLSTLTAARIGYLDYLNNATYGLEALEVNQQGIAADGCISDGNVYYVSLNGDNTTGLTWATAMNTIDAAVGLCTASNGDVIFVAPGTYNENANGAAGVTCDKIGITIKGVSIGVNITNTDTTNGGYVFNITANRTVLEDLKVYKGEVVSTGSTCVNVNANGVRISGITTDVEKAGFTGIKVLNGSVGTRIRGHKRRGQIFSTNAVGTGIDIDGTMADVCDISIRQLTVGVELGANSDDNVINDTVAISDCTTGVHLTAGAQSNTINALLAACTTIFDDASGNATNDRHSSLTHIHQDIAHVPKHTGALHFVDGTNGSDNNTGHSPEEAFATVNAGITAAAAGDRIYVRAGSYSEAGFNLNKDGLELVCENGTTLLHSGAGTVVTISNSYCGVINAIITEAGQIGIDIAAAASFSDIKDCVLYGCSVGIDVNSLRNVITNCRALLCTTTGFDIANGYNQLENCTAAGLGGASRGYYLSAAAADHNHISFCHSINNVTAGFEAVAGANNNVTDNSSTGGGDGAKVDGGANNTWANFTEGSQIVAGQTRDQDLKDIYDSLGTVLTQKMEVNEVVIYPVSEHAGTTEITDDGTSPAYYADTESGTATTEGAPNVHWSEDINFENAGTITIISMYLEMEWEHKTSAGTAYSKIQISRDSGANWVDVTDSIAEANATYQAKLREGVGNFIPTVVAGANQLEFRLVSWEAGGATSSAKIRSNSYVRITYRKS